MAEQRQYSRTKFETQCLLMDMDGNTYKAMIENISVGGALIAMSDGVPQSLQIGDVCDLLLCNNPELCPAEKVCRIARQESANIGVSFLTDRDQ